MTAMKRLAKVRGRGKLGERRGKPFIGPRCYSRRRSGNVENNMSGWRKTSLGWLCIVTVLTSCGGQPEEVRVAPRVLLLVIDCLRGDRYGAETPYERPLTPHLDEIAADGIRFTRTFSQASWTRPSLPTFLTGLYPAEHGLVELGEADEEGRNLRLAESVETVAERIAQRGYATMMLGEQFQLSPRFGLSQGFGSYNHKGSNAASTHHGLLEWLETAAVPWFAYLHYLEMHWPYCPPPEIRGRFTADWDGLSFCREWRQLRDDIRAGVVVLKEDEIDAMRASYDEELLGLDLEIGQLINELRSRGEWDETLVIVTSDHGEEFFEHGGMGHGRSLHDELISVPLVIKPPASWGGPRGGTVDALIEVRDLAATVLDAAGDRERAAELGYSLVPWLRGESREARSFVVSEHYDSVSVRTVDRKLIAHRDGSAPELYDLVEDPRERVDIASERPEEVTELVGMLRRWRAGLSATEAEAASLDEETLEGLRSLGYLQ